MAAGRAGRMHTTGFGLLLLYLLAATASSYAQTPSGAGTTPLLPIGTEESAGMPPIPAEEGIPATPFPENDLPYPTPLASPTQPSAEGVPLSPNPDNPPPQSASPSSAPGMGGMGMMSMMMGMGGMGMGGMGMIGTGGMGMGGFGGRMPYLGGYQGAEFFNSLVHDQNAHLGYYQQSLSALTPIWQDRNNVIMGTALVGVESFDTNAILPDTRQPFPSDLWNVNLGGNYRHLFDNGWVAGGGVSIARPAIDLSAISTT